MLLDAVQNNIVHTASYSLLFQPQKRAAVGQEPCSSSRGHIAICSGQDDGPTNSLDWNEGNTRYQNFRFNIQQGGFCSTQ